MVDIAGHLETKLAAIGCYQSQFPPEKANVYPRVRALAETVGLMAGCAAGELLAGPRIPVTTEPLRMLFLPHSGWAADCPSASVRPQPAFGPWPRGAATGARRDGRLFRPHGKVRREQGTFARGVSYPITVDWLATNRAAGPDYDYRAWIDRSADPTWTSGSPTPSSPAFFVTDTD